MAGNGVVSDQLAGFLDRETFMLMVLGAVGHNPTYRKGIGENRKLRFRRSLRDWLESRVEEYGSARVDDKHHAANIQDLSSALSERHADILLEGIFRVGTAQKALNLYLKYGWARGIVPEPPHCPLDRNVLAKIGKCASTAGCPICRKVPWTQIRSIEQYLHFIDHAKVTAAGAGLSIARWELQNWDA